MKKMILTISFLASINLLSQQYDSIEVNQLSEVLINKILKKDSEFVSKLPLKAIENPQTYTTINKVILDNQLLFTVDDALRNAVGVQKMWSATNRSGDGGLYVNLRGFPAGNSMRNGLVAPISSAVDAINLERIEILKGPSATLFGTNNTSYGGLINRVTKKPHPNFEGSLTASAGSYNFYRVHTDINAPITNDNKLLFRVNSAYTNYGNFQNNKAGNYSHVFTPALTYKLSDKVDIAVDFEMIENNTTAETSFFFNYPVSILGSDNMKKAKEYGYDYKESYVGNNLKTKSKIRNIFGQVNYHINNNITSSTNVSSSYSFSDGANPYFYFSPNPEDIKEIGLTRAYQATKNSKRNIFQIQQNFNFNYDFGKIKNKTVVGADFTQIYDNQLFLFGSIQPNNGWIQLGKKDYSDFTKDNVNWDASTYSINGTLNTYSAYIANVFTPVTGLNIMASVRYEENDYKGGIKGTKVDAYKQGTWSPKLGVVYELVPNKLSIFGNYQNSFKSNGYYIKDVQENNVLSKPEEANQIEGGFKAEVLKGRLNASLSYYLIDVKNTLLNTGEYTKNGFAVQNQAGKLISKGVELEVNAYLVKGFSLIAGVSYNDMKTKEASEDLINRRPATASSPWLVNFNASYQFLHGNLKGIGFGLGGNYASDNKIVNSASNGVFILPAYFVLNANAFYDTKNFRVGLKVDNITNKQYWVGYTTANAQPLTNIVGSITYKF